MARMPAAAEAQSLVEAAETFDGWLGLMIMAADAEKHADVSLQAGLGAFATPKEAAARLARCQIARDEASSRLGAVSREAYRTYAATDAHIKALEASSKARKAYRDELETWSATSGALRLDQRHPLSGAAGWYLTFVNGPQGAIWELH